MLSEHKMYALTYYRGSSKTKEVEGDEKDGRIDDMKE